VTWSDEQGSLVQEGVALRIVPAENGDVRAITVTKNVRLGLFFIFNVHVWDSTAETPFTQVGGANLEDVFLTESGLAPLPWRLCARVIGTKLDFKAWPIAAPEPAWNDGRYGASLTLPEGWNAPGYAGWYVGHLESGGSVRYSDMGTWKYVVADPTTTSSSTSTPPPRAPPPRALRLRPYDASPPIRRRTGRRWDSKPGRYPEADRQV